MEFRKCHLVRNGQDLSDTLPSAIRGLERSRTPNLEQFSSAIAVLTAMITPAVFVSACGALIHSTSIRLGGVIERVRSLSAYTEELARNDVDVALLDERRRMILAQLEQLSRRARLLKRALTTLYTAVCSFIFTSIAIAIVTLAHIGYEWIPVGLGIAGACFLCYGSVLLILEARLAYQVLTMELDFIWKLGTLHSPPRGGAGSTETRLGKSAG